MIDAGDRFHALTMTSATSAAGPPTAPPPPDRRAAWPTPPGGVRLSPSRPRRLPVTAVSSPPPSYQAASGDHRGRRAGCAASGCMATRPTAPGPPRAGRIETPTTRRCIKRKRVWRPAVPGEPPSHDHRSDDRPRRRLPAAHPPHAASGRSASAAGVGARCGSVASHAADGRSCSIRPADAPAACRVDAQATHPAAIRRADYTDRGSSRARRDHRPARRHPSADVA